MSQRPSKNRREPRENSNRREARENRHAPAEVVPARLSEADFFEQLEQGMPKAALVLVLDEVTDPHNLGACLRSANAAGAIAVLTPKNNSAKVTETVSRISCGAAEVTPVVQVTNLARAMKRLQEAGFWLVGTDDSGDEMLFDMDLTGPIGIVSGAEGTGLRRLTREGCDHLAQIPMSGTVECLNVSVATGVCLFEVVRQRRAKSKK
ncbi:MAG: 23S rRNA (guanosine2251-2'-O)-methyltransferase [Verrucomicrobiales bacterium]|jgi:23S rRNA (guanosine2251-2'-O)-methyltransferase